MIYAHLLCQTLSTPEIREGKKWKDFCAVEWDMEREEVEKKAYG